MEHSKRFAHFSPSANGERSQPKTWTNKLMALALSLAVSPLMAAPQTTITSGPIEGEVQASAVHYLGIPFAKPPIGELRWKAPVDPAPWTTTRETKQFADHCLQFGHFVNSSDSSIFDQPVGSEDCLYLNVWHPETASSTPRKVILFVYGGGGVVGTANIDSLDASRLANELDAVIVTTNYREHVLGSLQMNALHVEGDAATNSGDFTLLDIIKAMHWTQDNAAAFGGDPNNITVMGQSSGAISLLSLMRSDLVDGLFSKAILQSGIPFYYDKDKLEARAKTYVQNLVAAAEAAEDHVLAEGQTFDDWWGDTNNDEVKYNFLMSRTSEEILLATRGENGVAYIFDTADGYIFPEDPDNNGGKDFEYINSVPMIVGNMADEMGILFFNAYTPLTRAEAFDLNNSGLQYPQITVDDLLDNSTGYFLASSSADLVLRNVTLPDFANTIANTGVPVYRYRFLWKNYPNPWKKVFGAFHGLDMAFLWGNMPDSFQPEDEFFGKFTLLGNSKAERDAIHNELVTAVRSFIETGVPTTPNGSWPEWSATLTAKTID